MKITYSDFAEYRFFESLVHSFIPPCIDSAPITYQALFQSMRPLVYSGKQNRQDTPSYQVHGRDRHQQNKANKYVITKWNLRYKGKNSVLLEKYWVPQFK